jgi:fructose-1,6-bisphosphatase I
VRDFADPMADATVPAELRPAVGAIANAARDLAELISRHQIAADLGATLSVGGGGDRQIALDVIADTAFADALSAAGVRYYASEERESAEELAPGGALAVAIDPLDGSSNLNLNIPVGTIFGLYRAAATPEATFLRPGSAQIGAGYVIYGPQTVMMLSFGAGTFRLVLDRASGTFVPVGQVHVPPCGAEYAINASNARHWPQSVRAYIDECVAGADGPGGENHNMRWIASLVAEAHRVMTRGGVFLYPADARPGYQRGRLRRLYECAPIALLVEQAGGKATDGHARILDQMPSAIHERTPFVFGSAGPVDRVASFHETRELELTALFGERGLFRA